MEQVSHIELADSQWMIIDLFDCYALYDFDFVVLVWI